MGQVVTEWEAPSPLRWWRRSRAVVVAASLGFILGVLSLLFWQHWRADGRDEAGFRAYVAEFMDGSSSQADLDWVADNPEAVLAEGDRACRWLTAQPRPGVQPARAGADSYEVQGLYLTELQDQYLRATGEFPIVQIADTRDLVVSSAWQHLCPSSREDHIPPRGENGPTVPGED